MGKVYQTVDVLSSKELGLSLEELRGRSFDEFAQMGARLILEAAMREEVTEFLGRRRYERGKTTIGGYRNGRRAKMVQTGSGIIEVKIPKVQRAAVPFHSEVLPGWQRRSEELERVIPLLYAEGLSTRDFGRALGAVWKNVPRQRCITHKIRNVLNRVPKKEQASVKRELVKIFYAANAEVAQEAIDEFAGKFGARFPSACGVLRRDLEDCLTFYRFPQAHWRRLRTSNVLERAFREVRRRTDVVGRFPNETSALSLVWATMEQDRLVWRGVWMDDELRAKVTQGRDKAMGAKFDLKTLDSYLEAA